MILIQEYYESDSSSRNVEIKEALHFNLNNKNIIEIYLLNEKEYEYITELMTCYTHLKQIITNKRCTFKMAFEFSNQNKFFGSIIIVSNNDISFGPIDYRDITNGQFTLDQSAINQTFINIKKELEQPSRTNIILALSRYEKKNGPTGIPYLELFNRPDSQDSWYYKSPIIVPEESDFYFGLNGSDNRIAYLLSKCYTLKNKAKIIITVHHHKSNYRSFKPIVRGPHLTLDIC